MFIYLVLISVSCFAVLFSVLFCLQLSVVRPNRSQVVRIELLVFLSNRAVGPKHAQLKTKQNRKQDNKTRHRDQNKVNK